MDQIKLKIGILEDNQQLLSNIAAYVSNNSCFDLVFAEESLAKVVEQFGNLPVDYILLDEHLGRSSGMGSISLIKSTFSNVELILMTGDKDPALPYHALENGISGFIYKPFFMEDIKSVILNHYENGASMPPLAISNLIKVLRRNKNLNSPILNNLTTKEKEVIKMIKTGMSYKQIASEMDVTYNTVNFHLKNIFSKYEVNSIVQLMSKLSNN